MKRKSKKKPIASLSLDLDNQWSYLKVHGNPDWQTFPSYLDVVIPRALNFLGDRGLKITVFVTGQDAALRKNQEAIAAVAAAGHEIGNHLFHHEPDLHRYTEEEIDREVALAEDQIRQITGQQPLGFRAIGVNFSPAVLKVLVRRGYQYDASTCPTFLGPLARLYHFTTSDLTLEERNTQKSWFGDFKDGFQSLQPYRWSLGSDQLIEIPVTTLPIFKIPIHFSAVLFISAVSSALALFYFRCALWLCKLTKTQPSLVLHPVDFLGYEDVPELAFVAGMSLHRHHKLTVLGQAIQLLLKEFDICTVRQHAEIVSGACQLPIVELDLPPVINPVTVTF
ncbi:MAG: polysaccharide deacetylase family protein [Leptolyngbyaceae cyanobacterium CRU_2_3]|nr:polysaccharide deacetylase family protein [Leptolyngbyaceae cyanobacterium CRU_2_3]